MKKAFLLIIGASASLMMTSCNKGSEELKDATDSISYAYSVGYGNHISEQYLNSKTEGENYEQLIKGIKEAMKVSSNDSSFNYYVLGLQIGGDIKQSIDKGLMGDSSLMLNESVVKDAILKTLKKDPSIKMTSEDAGKLLQDLVRKQMSAAAEKTYGQYRQQQEAFLKQNGKRQGVTTTASGLQYEVITAGNGEKPTDNDIAYVNYKGMLTDGTEFDSSAKHGDKPADLAVTSLIPGWKEALKMMPKGSKWKLYIPSNLAYGSADMGAIKPFSTLVFDVELVDVKPAPAQQLQMMPGAPADLN